MNIDEKYHGDVDQMKQATGKEDTEKHPNVHDEKNKWGDNEFSFDSIWDRLPHISLYQWRLLLFVGYIGFIGGFMAIYPVFAQYKPPVRCENIFDTTPEYSFLTFEEIHAITTQTPNCQDYNADDNPECYFCDFANLDGCEGLKSYEEILECTSSIEFASQFSWTSCGNYTIDRSLRNATNMRGEPWETAATEFELYCGNEEINALLTSMGMVGLFIGAFIAGMYSDKFGRKNAIIVWSIAEIVCQAAHAFMPNVWGFMVFRVLSQMTNHVTWLSYITYSMEILGPSRRSVAGAMTHIMYSLGYMMTSVVGYFLPDWHGFTLCIAAVTAISFFTFPFYPESFRFYYNVGRYADGRKSLQKFAKNTKTELSDEYLDYFESNLKSEKEKSQQSNSQTTYSVIDLFKNGKELALISVNIGVAFMVNTLVYYGLAFNAAQLPGDLYVNNAINGFVELLAYLLCIALLDRLGRRILLGGAMIFGGLCCLASMILLEVSESNTDSTAIAATWCAFAGKFAISGSFCAVYVFAAELFSTDIRTIGVGFGSMFGRLGGVSAPFIILLPGWVPNLIFAITGILSGTWALFLPETGGKPMLQTIEEAKMFYKGKKASNTASDTQSLNNDEHTADL